MKMDISQSDHQNDPKMLSSVRNYENRPFSIKLLAIYALLMAFWNGLRLMQGVIFWPSFQAYNLRPAPIYIVISGGFWMIIGLIDSWGLWERKVWSWSITVIITISYGLWYWSDRLIFQKPHANWPFALGATFILISTAFSFLFSPRTRQSFKERHQ